MESFLISYKNINNTAHEHSSLSHAMKYFAPSGQLMNVAYRRNVLTTPHYQMININNVRIPVNTSWQTCFCGFFFYISMDV